MSLEIIDAAQLSPFGPVQEWPERLTALIKHQQVNWPGFAGALAEVKAAAQRRIPVCTSGVIVQHNPGRITSVTAAVDTQEGPLPPEARRGYPQPAAGRPCFLCAENIERGQAGLAIAREWVLLCNPAPIFEQHFTSACRRHSPQAIGGQVEALLEQARLLGPRFLVFFNGAKAGASAPDHLHLQVCRASALPLFRTISSGFLPRLCNQAWLAETVPFAGADYLVWGAKDAFRHTAAFDMAVELHGSLQPQGQDLLNAMVWWNGSAWVTVLVLRRRHRPACYYLSGPDARLISPGAIEMAGVIVAPRREDYERISQTELEAIYREVTVPGAQCRAVCDKLQRL